MTEGEQRAEFLAAIERARAAALKVKSEIDKAGPPCTRCRYYSEYPMECVHPAFQKMSYNPVNGDVLYEGSVRASNQRTDGSICGLEGRLWERRTFAQWHNNQVWLVFPYAILFGLVVIGVVGALAHETGIIK